ncbi:SDR family oxidoreductase [Croceimicrobium sp.]|uniref:SDR family oxidoreductase n=1 Tax=Croceimicrobium sp. TaxID=2828340 RepID=UPI003BABD027
MEPTPSKKLAPIIVAGASGYLGQHILHELKDRGIPFKALVRNPEKLKIKLKAEQIIKAEATQAESLKGVMDGASMIISSLGITRQKDGLSYWDVDYQANVNLLKEAEAAGLQKFVYVSVFNAHLLKGIQIIEAKEAFVKELQQSSISSQVIRPTGYFSDMADFLQMAAKGKVYLFGDGHCKLNPIHGADLAEFIVNSLSSKAEELNVGGPDLLSQNEIAALALDAYYKELKIVHLPDGLRKLIIASLKLFTSAKFYGPYEFFLSAMALHHAAPRFGHRRLYQFFQEEVNEARKENDADH